MEEERKEEWYSKIKQAFPGINTFTFLGFFLSFLILLSLFQSFKKKIDKKFRNFTLFDLPCLK